MEKKLELIIIMKPDGHVDAFGPIKKDTLNEFDPVCFFMLETAKKLMHKHNKKLEKLKGPALLDAIGNKI